MQGTRVQSLVGNKIPHVSQYDQDKKKERKIQQTCAVQNMSVPSSQDAVWRIGSTKS